MTISAIGQDNLVDSKISIAVLPFVKSGGTTDFSIEEILETVTKEFVDRKRFTIVDRTKFAAVMSELNIQKQDEFLNSKVIEQGKLAAAQFLVTGVVNDMKINKSISNTTTYNVFTKKFEPTTKENYVGFINVSYQVIDVATGTAVYQENITAKSTSFSQGDQSKIVTNTLCHLQHVVRKAILNQFPVQISILQVEDKDKKGLPKTVVINAGTNMFSEGMSSESACDGGIIIWNKHDKPKLTLFETEVYTAAGKEYHREKPVGVLEVTNVEGETSVCKVKDGEQAIQDAITNNKTLGIKIQQ